MKRVVTQSCAQKAIAIFMVICLFSFTSAPVLFHIHHETDTGEHITDFQPGFVNHFNLDVQADNHGVGNYTDDTHVIDSQTNFIAKKLTDAERQILFAMLCVLLIKPLLRKAIGKLTKSSAVPIPLQFHFNIPQLRAPPVHS